MGQLFSRAFKRITQGSQSRSSSQQLQQQRLEQQDLKDNDNDHEAGGPSEVIPVGQSIDSAEYGVLETNNNNSNRIQEADKENTDQNATAATTNGNSNNEKDVEGAVIKIQALVRGHLTRKALKDAHQQGAPQLNALGQSQFDEETLTRNPPSAVFSPFSPLNLAIANEQNGSIRPTPVTSASEQATRTPLASIAENSETDNVSSQRQQQSEGGRKKLAALSTRKTPSPSTLEMPDPASRGASPAPSHASIDLGHEEPSSASIDILDHNIKPADRLASVLHHREEPPKSVSPVPQPPPPTISTPDDKDYNGQEEGVAAEIMPAGTPDSLAGESEEAAAVRIQSAFRGYRTRKNSPYRTRSPNSNSGSPTVANDNKSSNSNSGIRNALVWQQQGVDTTNLDVLIDDPQPDEQVSGDLLAQSEDRHSSRPRHRDLSQENADEEATTTETMTDDSAGTVRQVTLPHPMKGIIGDSAALELKKSLGRGSESESLSFDIGQSSEAATTNTLDEVLGLSSALETGPQTYSSLDASAGRSAASKEGGDIEIGAVGADSQQAKQAIGTKESRASIDTDSSILGAALSLNEADISVAEQSHIAQPAAQHVSVPSVQSILEQIDEDNSLGVSVTSEQLESEARKLVDEITGSSDDQAMPPLNSDECALEEATDELEAALEEATSNVDSQLLDERNIAASEIESDNIERRESRGHRDEQEDHQVGITSDAAASTAANLTVELDEALASGRSSPVAQPSPGGSSSDEEADDDGNRHMGQQLQQQQHQQSQQQSATARNKKKNRNKRKGKK